MTTTILLVEDDPLQREMAEILLRKLGYKVTSVEDGRAALKHLQNAKPDEFSAAVLDIGLPHIDGLELLELIRQRHPALPCIMLTGNQELGTAVKAMQLGAYDFMNKPIEFERLKVVLANALKVSLLEKEVTRLKQKEDGALTFESLIGHENGLASVIRTGRKAAGTDIPVLLTGETGTGKEVFARSIHGESHRAGKPFVAVNCGALPANLVESILFGHEKGAFTGAIAKSIGKFREADGGTIFLDEVGDLPLDAQVKLLRVLQQKEITPVGADYTVPVNVRILSATHKTLENEVIKGTFREDLYFRLNVLSIHLPALRERRSDIPALVRHFLERFAASESRKLKDIAPAAMDMLAQRNWGGNVRELENAIHRAMVMSDGDVLQVSDFSAVSTQLPNERGASYSLAPSLTHADGTPRTLADIERDALHYALSHAGGNVTLAAKNLALAKSTFYRKLKEHPPL
ncbi:MAG: sigma-54-dependent Fis family transcriptional regulator [Proteobacteria bacterium]|nr:sigma-54-dependent Fis family transcriptional regulator [Pseudomonadota bacterium]